MGILGWIGMLGHDVYFFAVLVNFFQWIENE
jgi:hypothetical protein